MPQALINNYIAIWRWKVEGGGESQSGGQIFHSCFHQLFFLLVFSNKMAEIMLSIGEIFRSTWLTSYHVKQLNCPTVSSRSCDNLQIAGCLLVQGRIRCSYIHLVRSSTYNHVTQHEVIIPKLSSM